jgi:PAS domain-containing protein
MLTGCVYNMPARKLTKYGYWNMAPEAESEKAPLQMPDSPFGLGNEQRLDGIVILDRAGNVLDYEFFIPDFLEGPRLELIGHNIRDFVHPDDVDHFLKRLARAQKERPAAATVYWTSGFTYRKRTIEDGRWHRVQAWLHRPANGDAPDRISFPGGASPTSTSSDSNC